MIKRSFDIACSVCGLLLLSPLLLLLAAAIVLGSPGPVFYRGCRAGLRGKPFRIFKFRSMVINADQIGGPSTSDEDPRITGIGRLMRKFKLDELPQLLNVLAGDMSLVGPRPQVLDYVARYSEEEKTVLQVRPGITDWASIWNSDEGAVLAGHADPDKAYDELIHPTKMKLQLLYAQQHSMWVDLKILAYTFFGLVRRGWIPLELRDYPQPGEAESADVIRFDTVTELPGAPVNSEQLKMLHTRYGWAGDLVDGKDVLEVACGSGIGLGHLASRAKRVVGCDYDPKLAAIARRQYGGRIEVDTADAQSLPYPVASFDVVLLFEAIYYLENPERFLLEAHRVLRPGGQLLICTANCERPDFNVSPYSYNYFSAQQLRGLLAANGFSAAIHAGFPLGSQGWKDRVRQACRSVAVKLRLIPKTMKWKARIKRLFFGKLQSLPVALDYDLPEREP
ncbi:MAG: sugar transferase, partial [Planctomycetales bacterium]|nr:sugar transferase [Planctomycetales bacterium]